MVVLEVLVRVVSNGLHRIPLFFSKSVYEFIAVNITLNGKKTHDSSKV